MALVVCHMEKYGSGNLGGLERHNQRETENHANKDINPELSYLNYDLVNAEKISYPKKINAVIADGIETNRAIRKDAVKVCSFIISASPELFEKLEMKEHTAYLDEERNFPVPADGTRDYFKAATDFFKERYGEKNVVFATVHRDESTPHMHLGVVPVTADHKLSAKRIFNRKELQDLQKSLPEYLQQQGFDVEKGQSKNRHLDELEYKTKQAEVRAEQAQSKADEAEKRLVEKRSRLAETEKAVDTLVSTGAQKQQEIKKATKTLAVRAAQEIQLKAQHVTALQTARKVAAKIEESTETLGELQTSIAREEKNLNTIQAAAEKTGMLGERLHRIPVEYKTVGVLRNRREVAILDRKDLQGIFTAAKASEALRSQSERSERENKDLIQRNTRLENQLTESNREIHRLKGILEKKDALISHFQQAAKELFKNGESVFHQLVGYVKGRFMTGQKALPEEQKAFEQGAARTKKEFDELEKQFEQKQANKRQKGWEMER